MDRCNLTTPVAFFIFNRPHTTARVFEQIRQAKPKKLLVIADGPRADHLDDVEKCTAARTITEHIDWDCEVIRNYADTNLGLKNRISSGLNWVFDTYDEAIILEDDTLPHPTFFFFCQELLGKYRDDERIMNICGTNFLFGIPRTKYSYYYSRHMHCWGWATWRRAWQHYDVNMTLWPEFRDNKWLQEVVGDHATDINWHEMLEFTYRGDAPGWAIRWVFACWTQSGLSVIPNSNLVSNIGFGPEATNAINPKATEANMPVSGMDFPLKHPTLIIGMQ